LKGNEWGWVVSVLGWVGSVVGWGGKCGF